jgi:hypothetical protein
MKVVLHRRVHFSLSDEVADQVLKKYPEKTIAKDLLKELGAFAGDPDNILLSRTSLSFQTVSGPTLATVI